MSKSTQDLSSTFTDEEIAELSVLGNVIIRPAGTVLIGNGEDTDFALYLLKGHVKIVIGTDRTAALRGPGEIVGEMAALRERKRSASVVSVTEVEALYIPGPKWVQFLWGHPRAALAQVVAADDRLMESTRKNIESQFGAGQKLASALVELGDKGLGVEGIGGVTFRFSQLDLAEIAGLSRESVVQVIRRMKLAGVVSTGKRSTTVLDSDRLKRIADGELPVDGS